MIDEFTHHYIYRRVYTDLKTPEHRLSEGTIEPNIVSKQNAMLVFRELYNHLHVPTTISSSVENGIFISYNRLNYSITFEVYNDGDIVTLINDNSRKEILFCSEIANKKFDIIIDKLSELKILEVNDGVTSKH